MATLGRNTSPDLPFAWLGASTTSTVELAILLNDTCQCCPSLRKHAQAAVDALHTNAFCLLSLQDLLDATNISRYRWISADAKIAIFGCEEHDHLAEIEAIGHIDSVLLLEPGYEDDFTRQIGGLLRDVASEHQLELGAAAPLFTPAAQPQVRSFVALREVSASQLVMAEPVMLPSRVAQLPPIITEDLAPTDMSFRPGGMPSQAPVSVPPESAPSRSYFVRNGRAGESTSYFVRPKATSPWKWMFFVLLAGCLVAFWWFLRSPLTPTATSNQEDAATTPSMPAKQAQPDDATPALQVSPRASNGGDKRQQPQDRAAVPQRQSSIVRTSPPDAGAATPDEGRAVVAPKQRAPRALPAPKQPEDAALVRQSKLVNAGWVGGICRSGQDCSYPMAICLPTRSAGFCTRHCSTLCSDRKGANDTTSYCVDSPLVRSTGQQSFGMCLPACDYRLFPKGGCRIGARCRKLAWRRFPTQKKPVCVPIMRGL